MKTLQIKLLWAFLFFMAGSVFADGLMIPNVENYPKIFLKNRLTHVTVKIHGVVAETEVYQEFVNEWYDSTDAVYSFPLPVDARATEFFYWYDGIKYRAVLQVKEQATNPGTGEGGIIAEVNDYIGRNGIKVALKGIGPGNIQRVQLNYISLCDYYKGEVNYAFPLNTQDFITYPVEQCQFSLYVDSRTEITTYSSSTHPDFLTMKNDGQDLHLEFSYPKSYLDKDFNFTYHTDVSNLGVDFYSASNDTSDGHFALFVRPQNDTPADSVLGQRMFFLLSNSSAMFGNNLDQSIAAIKYGLDQLKTSDQFNILLFNYSVYPWQSVPVKATNENISAAKTYLDGINASSGSRMDLALDACFSQIKDDSLLSSILIFTNGQSPLDPKAIAEANTFKAGIFPFGIGPNLYYARLEMLAELNYGFVTYLSDEDNLVKTMQRVIDQISHPLLKDAVIEFGGASVSEISPEKTPSTYTGSYFSISGRYAVSGPSVMSMAGKSAGGYNYYDFNLNFDDSTATDKFVEPLWAKSMIDQLEWEIEIYGETEELKEQLIELSLKYNIRCRYTAYIADYETEAPTTAIRDKLVQVPGSFIQGNFPNPFNPLTTIRFFLDGESAGKVKLLKIYDILGRLIAVIDISHLGAGWHDVRFDGANLSSGLYFVRLQIGNEIRSTIKINLIR